MERGNARLKFFDRYLGPLLLLLLAVFLGPLRPLRRRRRPLEVRSVGILKSAAIGDTVLASAVIGDLKAMNPAMRIVLFVGGSNAAFGKRLSGVDRLVQLPLKNPLKALRLVREERFDVFVDLDPWPRISALLAALSRARVRLGFKTQGQNRHYMQDRSVIHRADQHELENYRDMIRAIGGTAQALPQKFGYAWSGGEKAIVFHLWPSGTQSHLKEWSPRQWARLAQELEGYRFVLTGGREDVERSVDFINGLPPELSARFSSSAGASFESTLALLQKAALLVSVNTGIMHVGAAMGVPTVGLHGPTNPLRWGPIGERTRAVASRTPGAGGLNLGFEYLDDTNHMDGLDFDEVVGACRELLGLAGARG
jgi:ADP-heptose:LPS heptosyltransferase